MIEFPIAIRGTVGTLSDAIRYPVISIEMKVFDGMEELVLSGVELECKVQLTERFFEIPQHYRHFPFKSRATKKPFQARATGNLETGLPLGATEASQIVVCIQRRTSSLKQDANGPIAGSLIRQLPVGDAHTDVHTHTLTNTETCAERGGVFAGGRFAFCFLYFVGSRPPSLGLSWVPRPTRRPPVPTSSCVLDVEPDSVHQPDVSRAGF